MVDILGTFDEKLEINNQIIDKIKKNLNNAFNLFYSKIKKNPKCSIGSLPLVVSDFVANGSFADLKKNVEILEETSFAYFIRNTDLKANTFERFVDEKTYKFLSKSSLYGNEVLISNVGDVGSVFLCPKLDKKMTLGNNMIFINSNGNEYYNYYLYLLFLSEEGQYLLRGITGGSAQPKFNKTDFRNITIPIPTTEELEDFNNQITSYIEKLDFLRKESNKIINIKNLYLQKFFG